MAIKYILKKVYLAVRIRLLRMLFKKNAVKEITPGIITSVVVIRIDRIGDMIMSLPAIKALKNIFPEAKVAVLLKPEHIPLLKNTPGIDDLIPYRGFISSIRTLKNSHFSLAVDLLMDYSLKTALIAFLGKAKMRAGFDVEGRGVLFNLPFEPGKEKKQMSKYLLDLVRYIGEVFHKSVFEESEPVIIISPEAKAFAQNLLRREGVKKGDILFGLHPGGQYPSQRWMPEGFAELADKISQHYQARIIIIGSFQEEKLINRLISLMKTKPILAVGYSLEKVAALISLCDLLICNNSGPLHIASAVGTPTVSTMGPTDPELWRPAGRRHCVVRYDLACNPCNLGFCRKHACMKLITAAQMEKTVKIQMERINKR